MTPWWITFVDGTKACVEASDESAAIEKAVKVRNATVKTVNRLPYPANPRLGEKSDCPSFCHAPAECAGRSACPQSYSCTE